MAPWAAEWAVCRVSPRRRLRPPPIAFRGEGADPHRLRAADDAWTVRAYEAHWRWYGPVLLRDVLARKRQLGLAFEPGFELALCQCATDEERAEIAQPFTQHSVRGQTGHGKRPLDKTAQRTGDDC